MSGWAGNQAREHDLDVSREILTIVERGSSKSWRQLARSSAATLLGTLGSGGGHV